MDEVSDDMTNRRARGLDRAFEILNFLRLKRQPLRPNEIASGIGAPRSSIYELVNLLVRQGVLEYRGDDGRVFLGRKLYFLGMAYAEQFDLMRECDKLLTHIAEETRETAQMCLLEGNKYTVAQMKEGSRPFRISSNVGDPVAIPWTASGRLLVAHMSDQEILDFIPKEDFRLPNGQWLDPAVFIAEVREASRVGYYTFDSAVETFTHCFAVPVYQAGRICVATLCLVAPREDGLKNHASYLKSLQDAAVDLSSRLGHTADEDGQGAVRAAGRG
ncbi:MULTISPECIES: IclR family transcriptional regulator [Aminobacter]|uniref:DNA-binding IclR family transcriptional regulator n=1 Tax=Aminobacter niigataensis TaxID=83265 RepID=A0ABR6L6L1_9HYPH|nr:MULTISPECIES: IclR family transcriptional regulator [Aminobacter]AWC25505.1 Kip operon repressor protein [Aminobacter sp. MSH1]MBB4652437.1 DNA-binding IclR family transcriptional regulator [Aminobacter niigataensis]CAI2936087.1 Kip operon repressor protein [Aminobacter niigataensis]